MVASVMELEPITKLTKDLKSASRLLTPTEARFMVDAYYQIQDYRKAAGNQIGSMDRSGEPHDVLDWMFGQMETLEKQVLRALDAWSDSDPTGIWAKSICGIGPVISAGLLAHIDITKCPTVGHIWSFAGMNPTQVWEKKTKRPWNADLKVLCWKIGESFVKVCNNEKDIYGKYYIRRKIEEQAKNEAGMFADQAAKTLNDKNYRKETEAYKAYIQGKLPDAHIHARAKRYAVKLFLSHWHHVAYVNHFGVEPPKPYPIAILNHAHYIEPL